MLSKKMAFSLMSLITIFALAFAVSPAMAQKEFKVTVTGRTSVPHAVADEGTAADTKIALKVETAQPVSDRPVSDGDTDTNPLGLTIETFRKNGLAIATGGASIMLDATPPVPHTAKVRYYEVSVPQALAIGANLPLRIVVTVPALTTNDVTVATTDKANVSKELHHVITVTKYVDTSGIPKVVSIQRLRLGSQTVVAAFQEERVDLNVFPTFDVRIVLTKPHTFDPANAGNLVEVENGTASGLVVGQKFAWHGGMSGDTPPVRVQAQAIRPHPIEGMYEHDGTANTNPYGPLAGVPAGMAGSGNVPFPNSDDNMYSQYRVTITPHQKSTNFDVKIKVKEFHDGKSPVRQTYIPPGFGDSVHLPNGRDILTVPVKGAARDLTAGIKVKIPKEIRIPGKGYLVIVRDESGSEVIVPPGSKKDAPKATERRPAEMIYNVITHADLPNLATQFLNGVVVDVQSQHAGLVVSEVMWGEDVSLTTSSNSQYIELYNPGGDYVTVDDADHTPDVNEQLTLIFYAPNEFTSIPAKGADGSLPTGVTDRIGTLDATGAYWSPTNKGQSGRSGKTGDQGELTVGRGVVVDPVPIVSMYRAMAADGTIDAMMGQMTASWMSSAGPKSANFKPLAIGIRHGTPGAATDSTVTPADTAAEEKAAADKKAAAEKAAAEKLRTTGTIPEAGNIYISEIMFAGNGALPQWIEIANGSATEDINLSGWTLTVDNATADPDVSISSAKFTIPDGTMINRSRQITSPSTVLIVTERGRNNIDTASNQVINLKVDNEVDLILAGVTTRRYTLLSDMAFLITLAPPAPAKVTPPAGETAAAKATRMAAEKKDAAMRMKATDMAGNLGADGTAAWALPMSEEGRSSIIRSHINVSIGPSEPEDGMMADGWVLASDTSFAQATHIRTKTYYGAMSDQGTPGFRAGGALPVELSHFRPVRDKATGQVVITWSTQSELNNAGFFIKRSNQKDGEFQVINATMVAGAGTTSEKQFYTYTDTTAQPNIVYYYQIEDVSLDGNRQTLTRGIRLKGHIGAAGKLTSTWGELKSSNE